MLDSEFHKYFLVLIILFHFCPILLPMNFEQSNFSYNQIQLLKHNDWYWFHNHTEFHYYKIPNFLMHQHQQKLDDLINTITLYRLKILHSRNHQIHKPFFNIYMFIIFQHMDMKHLSSNHIILHMSWHCN